MVGFPRHLDPQVNCRVLEDLIQRHGTAMAAWDLAGWDLAPRLTLGEDGSGGLPTVHNQVGDGVC